MTVYQMLLLGLMALLSLVDFILYGIDKKRARKREWRIPEAVLLWTGFLGGAAGALMGMKFFRHKTKHWYFWAINVAGLTLQLFALYALRG